MSKKCRAESKLRLSPIRLSRTAWYYEELKGICVVVQLIDGSGDLLGTTSQIVPWSKIEDSLKRRLARRRNRDH